VRMEWELTLDSSRVIEALSDDTLIFHQVHKKVWPTAQRDTCFWSHLRHFKKQLKDKEVDGWICVNYSMEDERVPRRDPIIRAIANVAMICSTEIIDGDRFPDKSKIPRDNIVCHITYVANVNPGGWVPAGVIRKVYKTIIPKIVKQFSQHVIDKSSKKPIMF
jgi:collagen type IV alpha-3-binding protein